MKLSKRQKQLSWWSVKKKWTKARQENVRGRGESGEWKGLRWWDCFDDEETAVQLWRWVRGSLEWGQQKTWIWVISCFWHLTCSSSGHDTHTRHCMSGSQSGWRSVTRLLVTMVCSSGPVSSILSDGENTIPSNGRIISVLLNTKLGPHRNRRDPGRASNK